MDLLLYIAKPIAVSLTFWHCLFTLDYTFSYQKCILIHTSSILRSKSWRHPPTSPEKW